MTNVTNRISEIKQPRGGYIKPSDFEVIDLNDGVELNAEENIHATIIGLAVDYLTRVAMGTSVSEVFDVAMAGSEIAEKLGMKRARKTAKNLLSGIKRLDGSSVINTCKLVTFDVWFRNPAGAMLAKTYDEIDPDRATIENIITMVKRSIVFFETYGPIVEDGFTFEPDSPNKKAYDKMIKTGKGSFGGYTAVVDGGDGDYLTKDTIWDFKVSKAKPTNKHTLQLLMYWIMGQHSGRAIYKGITKIGIFNPRLNSVYLLDVNKIPADVIATVEKDVICY